MFNDNKFMISFQSRFGSEPWLQPYTDETLEKLGNKNIKHLELRDRPWFALGDTINHLGGHGGKHYSFPSNHALNITSISYIFSSIYKEYSKYFWFYAGVIIFSRVYIGVHYPFDVVIGSFIGFLVGMFSYKMYNKITKILF